MRLLLYATVVNIQYCFWDNSTSEESGPMLITFEDNQYQHHIVKFNVLPCRSVRMYYHVGVRW